MANKLTTEDLVLNIIVNSNKAQSEIGKVSRELQDAKSKLKAVEAEMKKMERAGTTNSARYRALQSDANKYNSVIDASKIKLDALNQSLNLQDKSLKQLETSLTKTRQLWRQATNDTDRKRYGDEMEVLNNRINQLKNGTEQTGNSIVRMTNKLNQHIGLLVAGGASFVAFWTGIDKAANDYAKFDDVLADVTKTTDLTKEATKQLNAELEKFDTRTSQDDRLGLARIAGKLNYKSIEEITAFVEANNQIIVALNEDLGGNVEETVTKIGKLVDIFKLKDFYSTEEAFLKVGSAINELGMASTANEGYMVEFARRMAGVAPLAKISIDQILGLGAALDQLGQTEEVSSTALSKLFLNIAKDAETYSKYAGMKVKDFKALLEKDFMSAFKLVLEGVKNNSEGINQLAETLGDLGEDGGRVIGVIGVIGSLANNVDILTSSMELSKKAMKDGTSVTNEYNIKNETAAAILDRKRNEVDKLWRDLGEKLWPTYSKGLGLLTLFLRLLGQTITFISQNIKVISSLALAIAFYYTAVQVSAKWEAITTGYMAAKRIVALSLNLVYALLTGNITRAAAAQQLLNLRMMANPYGIVAAAIVGLTALIVNYAGKLSAVEKAQKAINETNEQATKDTAAQKFEIERLSKTIRDETKDRSLRLSAIQKLRDIMPDVLKDYSNEALMAGEATKAIEQQTAALLYQAKIKAKQAALDKVVEDNEKYNSPRKDGFWAGVGKIAVGEATYEHFTGRSAQQYEDRITAQNLALKDLQRTEEEYLAFKAKNGLKVEEITGGKVDVVDDSAAKKAEKERNHAFRKELEAAEKHQQNLLQQEGLFREDLSELSISQLEKLAQYEDSYQSKIDGIHKKYGENLKTLSQTANKELKRRAEAESKYIDSLIIKRKSEAEAEKLAYDDRLKKAGVYGVEKEQMTERQLQAYEILAKEHQATLNKIDSDAISKSIDNQRNSYREQLADLRIKLHEELAQITSLSQAKEVLSEFMDAKQLAQVRTLGQARRLLLNQQQLEEEQNMREHLEDLLEILRVGQETGQFEGINLSDNILSEEERKVIEDRIRSIREELSKLTGHDKTNDINPDAERNKVDIFGMSVGDWEKLFDNLDNGEGKVKALLAVLDAGTQVWGQYNKLVANKEDAQIQKDEEANNRKKENLRKRLDAGAISQESYNKQIESMDKDLDRKKAKVARDQAKRERNVALASAIVNTAKAVASVLPNFVLAGIVGAFGGLQVATIAKTPLPIIPGAESGGQFIEVTRSQDGKRFKAKNDPSKRGYVSNPTVLVGENGKEWVANASAVSNPTVKPILDVLDTAQKNGTINTLNLADIIAGTVGRPKISGRESGGQFRDSSEVYNQPNTTDPNLLKVLKKLDSRLSNLKAEVSLLGKGGFNEKMEELENIQNNSTL